MYPLCQVDHQLMCLSRLDVTGDGVPEVVACSWDGQTYIISQDSTLNNTDIDTLVKLLLSFRVQTMTFTAPIQKIFSNQMLVLRFIPV